MNVDDLIARLRRCGEYDGPTAVDRRRVPDSTLLEAADMLAALQFQLSAVRRVCEEQRDEAIDQVREQRAEMQRERDEARADVEQAARGWMMKLPEPGSDTARLMIANRLLRRENDELRESGVKDDRVAHWKVRAEQAEAEILASEAAPPITPEQRAVLVAALEWRFIHDLPADEYECGGIHSARCDRLLAETVDALRASETPKPRYKVFEAFNQKLGDCFVVSDQGDMGKNVAYCNVEENAQRIAAALNAHEPRT